MNRPSVSLAVVLAEALALWQELNSTSTLTEGTVERAARLVTAATTCHRALAASPGPPVPVVDRFERGPVMARGLTPLLEPDHDRDPAWPRRADASGLSSREVEVLQLIADGYRDRQIAEALFVSPRTVTTHVSGILNKLGAESRTAAVAQAIRQGLV